MIIKRRPIDPTAIFVTSPPIGIVSSVVTDSRVSALEEKVAKQIETIRQDEAAS